MNLINVYRDNLSLKKKVSELENRLDKIITEYRRDVVVAYIMSGRDIGDKAMEKALEFIIKK